MHNLTAALAVRNTRMRSLALPAWRGNGITCVSRARLIWVTQPGVHRRPLAYYILPSCPTNARQATSMLRRPQNAMLEESAANAALSKGCQKCPSTSSSLCVILARAGVLPDRIRTQIFGHLMPMDLLNLARTAKVFRRFLMARSAAPLWRAARNNAEDLPDCPSHLSEPEYANLVFDTHCQVHALLLYINVYLNQSSRAAIRPT